MRYALVVLAVVLALLVRLGLYSYVSGEVQPYATFYVAVAIVARWAGWGPATVTLVLGQLASAWFIIPPRGTLAWTGFPAMMRISTYFVVTGAMVLFMESLRKAQQRAAVSAEAARQKQEELEANITERERVEAALRASERVAHRQLAELETIYERTPVGLCFIDQDLRYVQINRLLAGMNGRTIQEHLGRTVREVLPESAEELEPLFRRVMETNTPVRDLEVRGPTPGLPGVERCWLSSY